MIDAGSAGSSPDQADGLPPGSRADAGSPRRRPPPMQAEKGSGVQDESVSVGLGWLQQLVNAVGEVDIHRDQMERQNRVVAHNLEELARILKRMQGQLRGLKTEDELSLQQVQDSQAAQYASLERPGMSVTGNWASALSESLNDLSGIGSDLRDLSRDLNALLSKQTSTTNELLDDLLRNHALPVIPATTDVLLVKVAGKLFAIPHSSVDWITQVGAEELSDDRSGTIESNSYTGHEYSMHYLGSMLGLAEPVFSGTSLRCPVLLVNSGEERVAVQIDELLGHRRVRVQSLGGQLGNLSWFTGGTILADGAIALLLDLKILLRGNSNTDRNHE